MTRFYIAAGIVVCLVALLIWQGAQGGEVPLLDAAEAAVAPAPVAEPLQYSPSRAAPARHGATRASSSKRVAECLQNLATKN